MIALPQASEAVRDPLVVALGLFVLGVLASDFFFRRHPMGRAGVRVIFLIFLTIVLLHADVVPYQPLQLTGSPLRDAVHAIPKIVWWLWAAWFLVGVVRALIVFQRSPREAKLLQDLLAGDVHSDRTARSGDCAQQHDRKVENRQRQLAKWNSRNERDRPARRQSAAVTRQRNSRTCDPQFQADCWVASADHRHKIDQRGLHGV